MYGGNNRQRGGNKETKSSNGNKNPSSSTKKQTSKHFQKWKYKFFGHEALKKNNGYTYGKIVEQILLKIQIMFEGPTGSIVIDSIRNHIKHKFEEPEMEKTTKAGVDKIFVGKYNFSFTNR